MPQLLKKAVTRVAPRSSGRALVVTLWPATETSVAEIEIREKGRRAGYRVSIASAFTMLATRAAGLTMQGRRVRRGKL